LRGSGWISTLFRPIGRIFWFAAPFLVGSDRIIVTPVEVCLSEEEDAAEARARRASRM
jgi:hypothetical protein